MQLNAATFLQLVQHYMLQINAAAQVYSEGANACSVCYGNFTVAQMQQLVQQFFTQHKVWLINDDNLYTTNGLNDTCVTLLLNNETYKISTCYGA